MGADANIPALQWPISFRPMRPFRREPTPLRHLFIFSRIDRDIAYALASRLVTAGGQLLTLGLISLLMAPQLQGYHFTFLSFVATQAFFELGFYLVVVNSAAHEWAQLTLDADGRATGDRGARDRLASLLRFSVRWYAAVSGLFVLLAMAAGWLFFQAQPATDVSWQAPWTALALGAGLQIWANAGLSFLEGCGQVAAAYRFRVIASGAGQICGWLILAAGGGLWTAPVMVGITAILQLILAARGYGGLFRSLRSAVGDQHISWRTEIWPLQWRLGLQGVVGFFYFSLFTPVTFHYHGAIAAGRVGLSWALANGIYSIMTAWLNARAPRLATLVAQGKDDELDRLFLRTLLFSTAALCALLAAVWAAVVIANVAGLPIAERFLPPASLAWFCLAAVLLQLSTGMSIYFRAHKKDPGTALNLAVGLLIGTVVWAAGAWGSPAVMAASFSLVLALVLLPGQSLIFLHHRRKWHSATPLTAPRADA